MSLEDTVHTFWGMNFALHGAKLSGFRGGNLIPTEVQGPGLTTDSEKADELKPEN